MKDDPVKSLPVCIEGQEASVRFDAAIRTLLSVSHAEIQRREAEYRKQSLANPNRRGPKPKVKPSASGRAEAEH
jgi:hypothetical protein